MATRSCVFSRHDAPLRTAGSRLEYPERISGLGGAYRDLPPYNFSSHLLQQLPELVAVMELTGVLWSDWGKPERIAETIRRIGKTPAFPLHCLDQPFIPYPGPRTANQVLAST